MVARMTRSVVRFGPFELDLRARELRAGTSRVRLQDQPFEILRLLLDRPGEVVTRSELRRQLWPDGTFVDFEHSLNAAVKRLRAALGDDADSPRFVETLPRRGYRFIAPLDGAPDGSGASATAPLIPRVRLAVLPFQNLSGLGDEYFTDGLTEELIAQLGALCGRRVGVIARWSSMVFKGSDRRACDIGEALRVGYLLEGSVRREGDRVRITARLVDTSEETHLWSATYDRNLTDCLAVQTEVTVRIAGALAAELDPGGRPSPSAPNSAAYQAYLKGRYYWNKPGDDGLDSAIGFFEEAIAREPALGAAHAALARALVSRAEHYRQLPKQALLAARATAARAIEIDGTLYEAHLAMGDACRMLDWDWAAAEAGYLHAIALNPSYESAHRAYAVMLGTVGRHAEAVRESERACELDPLCLVVGTSAAWVRYAAGDYVASIEHSRNTVDMDPEFVPARRLLGAACLQAGRDAEALAELELVAGFGSDPVVLTWLAHAKAISGARREAAALIARARALESERYVSGYHLAIAYAGVGDLDAAFDSLDRASLDRDPALPGIAVEPRLQPLREDARFQDLLARLGLAVPGVHARA
jgi:TolB-like protein/tetratricopeptide (TPR) repeat protein